MTLRERFIQETEEFLKAYLDDEDDEVILESYEMFQEAA
jgi:hypothetical protein